MEKNRVFFQKPNLELFDSMGLKSVDMHYHSRFSDSYTRVQTIIKKAKKNNIGVSITDHNAIEGSLKASRNAQDVMVIPGIEVSSKEGPHILFYFYDSSELTEFYENVVEPRKQKNPYMAIDMGVPELIERSKAFNCIRAAAHPYGYAIANNGLNKCVSKHYVSEKVLDSIDAMEVINGSMNRKLNIKANEKNQELGKGMTGGSDGHTIHELGRVVTSAYADNVESFLNSILKKKNYVVGKETLLFPKINHGTNVVARHMRYAGPSISLQYRINKGRVRKLPGKIVGGIRNRLNGKNSQ